MSPEMTLSGVLECPPLCRLLGPSGVGKATTALVRARQPRFGTNRRDIARCQLEPQLQDFLSRHAFHVSNEFVLRNGIGVLGSIAYVLPYQQAREECAETPLCLVLQRNVGMLEIFSFDVELLEDFAQPFDRRIALMTTPTTTRNEAHRQSDPVLEIAIAI